MRQQLTQLLNQATQFLDTHSTEIIVSLIAAFLFAIIIFFLKTPYNIVRSLRQRLNQKTGPQKPRPIDPQKAQRNRRNMLDLVENIYTDRLENSLHGAVMLDLGLKELPGAVKRPWDTILKIPGQTDRLLPGDTEILDIFDQAGHALLILGEPGSGKTTQLLDLAQALIARARNDDHHPIPVLFNLSTWTDKNQSLDDWLITDLRRHYYIPETIARSWLEQNQLCPLLDGLDEVAPGQRDACVRAINTYRQTHPFTQLTVCCRTAEYEALHSPLTLHRAIEIQPLTGRQIDAYLDGVGLTLAAVRRTLQTDAQLRHLTQTPLMLSIMALAYKDKTPDELRPLTSLAARRAHIFDSYIDAALTTRGDGQRYPHLQTRHRLAWLAHQLNRHHTTSFLLEDLQPDWLTITKRQELWLKLVFKQVFRPSGVLGFGLSGGLSGGLVFGLVFGLVGGLGLGPLGGLLGGLLGASVGGLRENIKPTEKLKWYWRDGLSSGLAWGLVGGLVGGLTGWQVGRLGFGLFYGLSFGLAGGLFFGFNSSTQADTRVRPNQGIWQSARNFLLIGLIFGLVGGLVFGLFIRLGFGPNGGLVGGLAGGLIGVVYFGGAPFIKHFILRFLLQRQGVMPWPWQYVPFLDYAESCILLQKTGPGYRFHHELLQNHFAAMYKPDPPP